MLTGLVTDGDIRRREEVWRARREFFSGDFPVSTLVEIRALGVKVVAEDSKSSDVTADRAAAAALERAGVAAHLRTGHAHQRIHFGLRPRAHAPLFAAVVRQRAGRPA